MNSHFILETLSWDAEPLPPLFPEILNIGFPFHYASNLTLPTAKQEQKKEPVPKPKKKQAKYIKNNYYIYLDTLENVKKSDLRLIKKGKPPRIGQRRVMLYATFLHPSTKIITTNTKTLLTSKQKMQIIYKDGDLLFDNIKVEVMPLKKRGRKLSSQSQDNDYPAKRRKNDEELYTPVDATNPNLFFAKNNINMTSNETDYLDLKLR